MRVSSKSSGSGNAPAVGGARPAASPSAPVGAAGGPSQVGDALSVSSTAQFIAVAEAQIARIPDIRASRVEALKARLDADQYSPDGEAVADGIIRDHTPPRRDP